MKFRLLITCAKLAVYLIVPCQIFAQGKSKQGGGNDGGGGGGSTEPVINYELSFIGNPTGAGVLSGRHLIFGCNAFGEFVGRVEDSSGAFKVTYYSPIAGTVDLTATNGFQA